MPEAKSYNLYVSLILKVMAFGMLAIFAIVGILFLSGIFESFEGDGPPRFVGLFFLGIGLWNGWYWLLSIPYKIIVSETGEITFVSLARRKKVNPGNIKSIKPESGQIGFLVVRTSHGKIRILNQFDGFHDLISNLKTNNPSIELRGC